MLTRKVKLFFLTLILFVLFCNGNIFLSWGEMDKMFVEYIQKGYIELGMTKEEVQASWGKPKKIILRKVKDYDEIWVYAPNWKFRNKLFFYQGILVQTDPDYLVVSKMQGHGVLPK